MLEPTSVVFTPENALLPALSSWLEESLSKVVFFTVGGVDRHSRDDLHDSGALVLFQRVLRISGSVMTSLKENRVLIHFVWFGVIPSIVLIVLLSIATLKHSKVPVVCALQHSFNSPFSGSSSVLTTLCRYSPFPVSSCSLSVFG